MDLSGEVSVGLDLLGDRNQICVQCFDKILQIGSRHLVSDSEFKEKTSDLSNLHCSTCSNAVLKQSYSAFTTLLLETKRHDVDSPTLLSLLEEKHWNNQRVQQLNAVFAKQKKSIQAVLNGVESNPPHIVDVDWRLDYCLKNSNMEHVNSPFYLIDLHAEDQQKPKKIQFACSLEELQDLVAKLKEALKCVEKSSQS